MPVSYHGHPIIRLKAATSSDKSAIFCNSSSGCLVWKIVATMAREGGDEHNNVNDNNNEMEIEMLLLFNLHDEKFQFIRLPTKSPADEQQKQLLVDYPHLLEFKGYPCIASLEKGFGNGSDDYCHRRCRDHHDSTSCCKVHMYILKDNVKQVWVKQESLDVRMTSHGMSYIGIRTLDPAVFALAALLSLVLVSSVSLIRFYSTGLLGKNFKFTTCIPKNLIL
ncbi:uncharacterized protein LOC113319187 [Papaver somniferum]|uniref:uncharacterized protein LOC113319187 n=1 Tax=Papaver somniferum TaxID=3469 RepID=UPI000E6FF14C|nr:uncharacterized protein LOC113319187 [Papaver somniferum]